MGKTRSASTKSRSRSKSPAPRSKRGSKATKKKPAKKYGNSTLREVFDSMDTDGSNSLDYSELKTALEKIDIVLPDRKLHLLLAEADTDEDQAIDFEEFESIVTSSEKWERMANSWGRTSHFFTDERVKSFQTSAQLGFIRKVYGILTAQVALTVVMSVLACTSDQAAHFFNSIASIQYIPAICLLVALNYLKESHPANMVLLLLFTICQGSVVASVCAMVTAFGRGDIIVQAALLTCSIFGSLTGYTFYTKRDFSYMRGFLSAALGGLCFVAFCQYFIFPRIGMELSDPIELVIAFFGAMTFVGYILYDTWRIQETFGVDDYVVAAIELYLDIINLFIYIVKILLKIAKIANDMKKKD